MLIAQNFPLHSQAYPTSEIGNSNINEKYQKALLQINKLELHCEQWLKSKDLQHQYELAQEALSDSDKLQEHQNRSQKKVVSSLKLQIEILASTTNNYFTSLREVFVSQNFVTLLTETHLSAFFDDQFRMIENKVKLLEAIQKLKLFKDYPETQKRIYSLSANIILKKWLLKNYNNPYPNQKSLEKLRRKTNLSKQQVMFFSKKILNYFINSRNSFKKSQQKESKFKKLVSQKFFLLKKQKRVQSQILSDSTNIKNQNEIHFLDFIQ